MKQVNLKVLIEGYVDQRITTHSQMRSVKLNQGVAGATATDCDDVTVELLNDDIEVVASDLVTLDILGNAVANFDVSDGLYWLAVKHRTAIKVFSTVQIEVSETHITYDFTTDKGKTFESNSVLDHIGNACMISGDINQDGTIDNLDAAILEGDVNNFKTGYLSSDLNGDGAVDNLDLSIFEGKVGDGFIEVKTPPVKGS